MNRSAPAKSLSWQNQEENKDDDRKISGMKINFDVIYTATDIHWLMLWIGLPQQSHCHDNIRKRTRTMTNIWHEDKLWCDIHSNRHPRMHVITKYKVSNTTNTHLQQLKNILHIASKYKEMMCSVSCLRKDNTNGWSLYVHLLLLHEYMTECVFTCEHDYTYSDSTL